MSQIREILGECSDNTRFSETETKTDTKTGTAHSDLLCNAPFVDPQTKNKPLSSFLQMQWFSFFLHSWADPQPARKIPSETNSCYLTHTWNAKWQQRWNSHPHEKWQIAHLICLPTQQSVTNEAYESFWWGIWNLTGRGFVRSGHWQENLNPMSSTIWSAIRLDSVLSSDVSQSLCILGFPLNLAKGWG